MFITEQSESNVEDPEDLVLGASSGGDYPIDDILIRNENRTIYEVYRRMNKNSIILDPDFQRDFTGQKTNRASL